MDSELCRYLCPQGEGGRRPDGGLLQSSQFPHIFSSKHSLSHHLWWSPLSHWARVFSKLISLMKINHLAWKNLVSFFSFSCGEKVAAGRMREFWSVFHFPHFSKSSPASYCTGPKSVLAPRSPIKFPSSSSTRCTSVRSLWIAPVSCWTNRNSNIIFEGPCTLVISSLICST